MYQVRSWLSEQIASLHDEVDRRSGAFDLRAQAGADSLVRFLAIGVHDLESGLHAADAAAILPEYNRRTRRHLMPAPIAANPVQIHSDAEAWGALYVLEGSRLGGRWLAKQSAELRKNPFFANDDPAFWPVFLSRLDTAANAGADRAEIRAGAVAAFGAFLRVHPEDIGGIAFVEGAPGPAIAESAA